MDFKLKFNGLRVPIVHHADFDHVEDDEVLTRTRGYNLHAADDVFTVRNSQISHKINKLLGLWANTSSKIQHNIKSLFHMWAYQSHLDFLLVTVVVSLSLKRIEIHQCRFTYTLLSTSKVYPELYATYQFYLQRVHLFFTEFIIYN